MHVEAPELIRILTVCTGNICRSPVAERLLQAGLDQIHPGRFSVESAGTRAMAGDGVQSESMNIIRFYGGSAENFAARQVTATMLREQDLVLTMDSGHRTEVLHLNPALLKRTFTIREFARMLNVLDQGATANSGDGGASWKNLSARATAVRHLALAQDPAENDVIDPYRRGPEVYRRMEEELTPAVGAILRFARLSRL